MTSDSGGAHPANSTSGAVECPRYREHRTPKSKAYNRGRPVCSLATLGRLWHKDGASQGTTARPGPVFENLAQAVSTIGVSNLSAGETVGKNVAKDCNDADAVFYLFLQKQKIGAKLHIYL